MVTEEYTIHIPHLPLIPICPIEHPSSTRHGAGLVRVRFDSNPALILDTQKVIHNLESFIPRGIIHTRNVDELFILALGMVSEEGEGLVRRRMEGRRV